MKNNILFSLLVALPSATIFTSTIYLVRLMIIAPLMRQRLRNKAVRQGTVAKATLYESSQRRKRPFTGQVWFDDSIAVYKYEYEGQTYFYNMKKSGSPAQELNLYFKKNPKCAVQAQELGFREVGMLKVFIVILVVLTLLFVSCS